MTVWEKTSAAPFKNMLLKGWLLQPAQMALFNKHCIMKVWKSLIPKTLQRHNHLNTQAKWVNEKYNQIECTKGTEGMKNIVQLVVENIERIKNNIFPNLECVILNQKEINCSWAIFPAYSRTRYLLKGLWNKGCMELKCMIYRNQKNN